MIGIFVQLGLGIAIGIGINRWIEGQNGDRDDRGSVGSSGIVRDAGPAEQSGIEDKDWDIVDQQNDESFPASDPPGNY